MPEAFASDCQRSLKDDTRVICIYNRGTRLRRECKPTANGGLTFPKISAAYAARVSKNAASSGGAHTLFRGSKAQQTGREARADNGGHGPRRCSIALRPQRELPTPLLCRPRRIWASRSLSARTAFGAPYLIGTAGLFYTSNPSLSNDAGRGDLYFVGGGGAGLRPNVVGGLYLDGHVSDQVFQYAQFSSLNFNYFNAGGGLDYVFEFGQLTASVRYEYQRYIDGDCLDEFYVNNALTFALYKEFPLNEKFSFQAGTQAAISLTAEPASARFNEFDFWVGSRWRILTPLELQTFYVLSLFYYPQGDTRTDVTNTVGAALTLEFTRWARLVATTSFSANNSTNSFFEYTVVNVGGILNLDFRF